MISEAALSSGFEWGFVSGYVRCNYGRRRAKSFGALCCTCDVLACSCWVCFERSAIIVASGLEWPMVALLDEGHSWYVHAIKARSQQWMT